MTAETIVALSSGALPAGLAVLRISGPASRLCLERLAGRLPEPRRASLRRLRNAEGGTIDRGIVLLFEGPASVTGEDLAEIHLHGGRAVVAACLDVLAALPGVRLAQAGEFTRRAFENGRIDLTEAEGLADLLAAETEAQRAQAVAQSGGALRALYEGWMSRLVRARALYEASFDFADEGDVGDDVAGAVHPSMRALAREMRLHLSAAGRGEILRHGYRVAIVGPPNVGKSSLLNALADREAAIVSDVPGTTRDVIEVALDLGGVPVRVLDTAGLRETADTVEAIGVERAMAAMASAHLVLVLGTAKADPGLADPPIHVKHPSVEAGPGRAPRSETGVAVPPQAALAAVLKIRTKSDLAAAGENRFASGTFDLSISVKSGEGLSELVARIAASAREAAGDPSEVVPMRLRHRDIVAGALATIEEMLAGDPPPEIAAEALRHASDRLGALTGRVGVEDLLDVVFSEFCIGK